MNDPASTSVMQPKSSSLQRIAPWIALLLLFAGTMAIWTALNRSRQTVQSVSTPDPDWRPPGSDEPVLSEYTLTERSGKKFESRSLQGHVHVVSFFFANCPTYCRLQNTKLSDIQREFSKLDVTFVSITCDPDNDTPERLAEYADQFAADRERWLFLTGKFSYLRRVAGEIYQLPYARGSHAENFLVYDRWGNRRGKFHWNKSPEIAEMKRLLRKLLEETEPPAVPPEASKTIIDEETGRPITVEGKP